jgi:hypothetical protein
MTLSKKRNIVCRFCRKEIIDELKQDYIEDIEKDLSGNLLICGYDF